MLVAIMTNSTAILNSNSDNRHYVELPISFQINRRVCCICGLRPGGPRHSHPATEKVCLRSVWIGSVVIPDVRDWRVTVVRSLRILDIIFSADHARCTAVVGSRSHGPILFLLLYTDDLTLLSQGHGLSWQLYANDAHRYMVLPTVSVTEAAEQQWPTADDVARCMRSMHYLSFHVRIGPISAAAITIPSWHKVISSCRRT